MSRIPLKEWFYKLHELNLKFEGYINLSTEIFILKFKWNKKKIFRINLLIGHFLKTTARFLIVNKYMFITLYKYEMLEIQITVRSSHDVPLS